ncbi:molybdopterin converting factor small subunit [Mycolicibacterium iranicum]|uniref:Molybdopterin synthase sulfur carrier subunit n=1 Tax=Mycolicibacterium iranicum TaxID=912594 RepID=A0A839QC26_MYCIR|nr:MoaD/ThiS family protein [Mycolicibacterium iranicum]MBB2990802.1 molybdopterin converting factor small subunit [Mycolicibacterium iranicum]
MEADLGVRVTVRFFAAARAAAGVESEMVELPAGATVDDLVAVLRRRDAGLAKVLARCSYLRDGVAVRDMATELGNAPTIDVLPPFAGG